MTRRAEFEQLLRGPAFLTDEEAELISAISSLSNGNAMEIGVGYGGSTTAILCNLPKRYKLISVDPFVQDSHGSWSASEEETLDGVKRAVRTLTGEEPTNWSLVKKTSRQFFADSAHGKDDYMDDTFGLVFIDGDHNYKEVKFDIQAYSPLVKIRGFLVLHDARRDPTYTGEGYAGGWEGPTACAKEMIDAIHAGKSDFELYEEIGSTVVFRRVKGETWETN